MYPYGTNYNDTADNLAEAQRHTPPSGAGPGHRPEPIPPTTLPGTVRPPTAPAPKPPGNTRPPVGPSPQPPRPTPPPPGNTRPPAGPSPQPPRPTPPPPAHTRPPAGPSPQPPRPTPPPPAHTRPPVTPRPPIHTRPVAPPPTIIPVRVPSVRAVDPGAIRGCMFNPTYVWLRNGGEFWFFPTFLGARSVAGFRWSPTGWYYIGFDLDAIDVFSCS